MGKGVLKLDNDLINAANNNEELSMGRDTIVCRNCKKPLAYDDVDLCKRCLFKVVAKKLLESREAGAELEKEPESDIAICSQCGWRGPVSECKKGKDGDWESGYYDIDLCPKCEDGGCIDDYDMTPQRGKEWKAWYIKQKAKEE